MKKILFFLLIPFWVDAQVKFSGSNVATVFADAKAQNKAVFVEMYSPSCHVCASFVATFQNANVGTFYNQRFVSVKVDVNSQEGQAFLKKYKIVIPSLPLMLFFEGNGKLLHAQNVNNSPNDLIAMAGNALSPTAKAGNYANRFKKGERDPNFLIEYGYFSKITSDTTDNIEAMNAYAKGLSVSDMSSQTSFLVLQKVVMDADNKLFENLMNNLASFRTKFGAEAVKGTAENIIMSTLVSGRAGKKSPEEILGLGAMLSKIGLDKKTVENRTVLAEINAYFNTKQTAKAVARIDRYIAASAPGAGEYFFLGRLLSGKTSDSSALQKSITWLNSGIQRSGSKADDKAEAYGDIAEIYLRLNNKPEAKKAATLAINTAKAAKISATKFEGILAKTK